MYLNKAAIGDFAGSVYWSSTQFDNSKAWNQNFSAGQQNHDYKNEHWNVRAVRAF